MIKIRPVLLSVTFIGFAFLPIYGFAQSKQMTQEVADSLYTQQLWSESIDAFLALLETEPVLADNWFKLARSYHEIGELSQAKTAYETALKKEYSRKAQAKYHLARLFVEIGDNNAALLQLEELPELGTPSAKVLLAAKEFNVFKGNSRFEAVIQALRPCSAIEYRHFDFWLGEWNVTAAGKANSTAQNKITSSKDGCAIVENYTAGGFSGMSLNFFDVTSGKWHQSWMSNAGGAVYLEGGLTASGAMRMSDSELPISKITGKVNRVTWTPLEDGSVRQLWEQKDMGSHSWATIFDGNYTKKNKE